MYGFRNRHKKTRCGKSIATGIGDTSAGGKSCCQGTAKAIPGAVDRDQFHRQHGNGCRASIPVGEKHVVTAKGDDHIAVWVAKSGKGGFKVFSATRQHCRFHTIDDEHIDKT